MRKTLRNLLVGKSLDKKNQFFIRFCFILNNSVFLLALSIKQAILSKQSTQNMCTSFPPSSVCSANGFCDNSTGFFAFCRCTTPGFSSIGDYRFQAGLDCDVYLPAVLALWALVLICSGIGFLISTIRITRNRSFSLNALTKVHLSLMSVEIGWFIVAAFRLSDIEGTAIGMNAAVTWISSFAFMMTSVAALNILFSFYSVHTSLLNTPSKIKQFRNICFMFTPILLLLPTSALWGLYVPEQYGQALEMFFLVSTICNFGYSFLSIVGFTPMLKGLDSSIKAYPDRKADLEVVRFRISTVRRELTVEPFFCGVLYLVFAFWPYLRMKAVYQFPVQILLWIVMCLGISLAISTYSSSSASKPQVVGVSDQVRNSKGNLEIPSTGRGVLTSVASSRD